METLVRRKSFVLFSLALILVAGGCAMAPVPTGSAGLLDFLLEGKTTKTEAILKLGQPSGRFEDEKILTYRLGQDDGGYYLVEREAPQNGWPTWTAIKFSLVLVFDEAGVLREHSLVKVNK